MAHFFRKSYQKKQYHEIDADFFTSLASDQPAEEEISGYLKVQLPKTGKLFLKKRSWIKRYCYLSKSEMMISKNEKFCEFEKSTIRFNIPNVISMKVFQNVERLNKKSEKHRRNYMPPRFVEIVDESKKKFRLSFINDDEMNYWLSELFKAFNKARVKEDTTAELIQKQGDELFLEYNQLDSCQIKTAPIPAPRLSKLKLLAGAMDEEKQQYQNAEYKNTMEIRANMLVDRKRELIQLLNSDELVSRVDAISESNENLIKVQSKPTGSPQSFCCENQLQFERHCDKNVDNENSIRVTTENDHIDHESSVMKPLIIKKPISVPLYPLCFTKFKKTNDNVDESVYLWSTLPEYCEQPSFDSTKYAVSSEKSNFSGNFPNRNETISFISENNKEKIVVSSKAEISLDNAANSTFIVKEEDEIEVKCPSYNFENGLINDSDCRHSPLERPKIMKAKCSSCGCDRKKYKSKCSPKSRIKNRNFFNDSCNVSAPSEIVGDKFSDGLALGDVSSNLIGARFRFQSSDFMKKMRDMYDSKSSSIKNASAINFDPWSKVRGTGQFTSYNHSTSAIPDNAKCFKLPEFEEGVFRSLSHFCDQGNQKHNIACKLCRSYPK